jgi:transmembrane sensor
MDKITFDILVDRINEGIATEDELRQYNAYMNHLATDQVGWEGDKQVEAEEVIKNELWDRISNRLDNSHVKKMVGWPRIVAAASIILCLSIGSYFIFHKQLSPDTAQNQIHDILPGGNKAILILANGNQIVLTSVHKGKLSEQGKAIITKTEEGEIIYQSSGASLSGNNKPVFNTIVTPRGGQYCVVLPDGSKVLLNALSSLRYPTAFTGTKREVELNGEAYFEVAKNKKLPFIVKTSTQEVQVLGTHFNINSYTDEAATKTTLLEGSVLVRLLPTDKSLSVKSVQLVPGQQSTYIKNNNIHVQQVDIDDAVAWKEGIIQLDEGALDEILRNVARWYDVEIVYENQAARNLHFGGSVSRFSTVSHVLSKLELTNSVHFKIEGRRIIVMK